MRLQSPRARFFGTLNMPKHFKGTLARGSFGTLKMAVRFRGTLAGGGRRETRWVKLKGPWVRFFGTLKM